MAYTGKPEHNLIRAELLGVSLDAYQWSRTEDDGAALSPLLGGHLPSGGDAAQKIGGYGIDHIVQEAERMIRDAEDKAERILDEARRTAKREEEQIFQEALEKARREAGEQPDPAREEALADLRHAAEALVAAANAMQHAVVTKLEEMEHSLAVSAVDVAENIVGCAVSAEPEIVQRSVKDVLNRLSAGEVTLRLNPADLDTVKECLLELQAERSVGDVISFESDPNVERGGCVGSGESGNVQSLPSAKLAQLRAMAAE